MKKRIGTALSLVLLFSLALLAHGDKKHVMGTVEKIGTDSVVVKTNDGKSVEVKLTPSTMYVSHAGNQDKPAKLSDLAVGDRVIIHATPSGETLSADQIKFTTPAAQPSGAGTKPKQ